eukprot:1595453-Amphidinium_carterae.2
MQWSKSRRMSFRAFWLSFSGLATGRSGPRHMTLHPNLRSHVITPAHTLRALAIRDTENIFLAAKPHTDQTSPVAARNKPV